MDQTLSQTEEVARAAFAQIAARFPHLQIVEDSDGPIEISLNLPVQSGLKHAVWLSFQNNDELHLSVGHFWCEWFPCTDPAKVEASIDSVSGFLSGNYRSGECFKAQLQRPTGNEWETIATWSRLRLPSFRTVSYREVTNA